MPEPLGIIASRPASRHHELYPCGFQILTPQAYQVDPRVGRRYTLNYIRKSALRLRITAGAHGLGLRRDPPARFTGINTHPPACHALTGQTTFTWMSVCSSSRDFPLETPGSIAAHSVCRAPGGGGYQARVRHSEAAGGLQGFLKVASAPQRSHRKPQDVVANDSQLATRLPALKSAETSAAPSERAIDGRSTRRTSSPRTSGSTSIDGVASGFHFHEAEAPPGTRAEPVAWAHSAWLRQGGPRPGAWGHGGISHCDP